MLLKEMSSKFDESIESRKEFQQKFDLANFMKLSTPDKMKKIEDSVAQVRIEYNEKIEQLNYEILR